MGCTPGAAPRHHPRMRIAVISDTHLPARGRTLPPDCIERLAGADLIIHAGDWSDLATVRLVRGLGPPVVGVHGNVDEQAVRRALPATATTEAAGVRIAVVHDAGSAARRREALRRRFPEARIVVFGHSHIPLLDTAPDGFMIVNPGSPTDRRRQPRHTMAMIELRDGGPPQVTFRAVDDPPGPLPHELLASP